MDSDINFSQSYLNDNIYYEIEDVDSTNNFLEVLAKKHDIKQKAIVRADFQSQGKGNQNTTWESEKGKNQHQCINAV